MATEFSRDFLHYGAIEKARRRQNLRTYTTAALRLSLKDPETTKRERNHIYGELVRRKRGIIGDCLDCVVRYNYDRDWHWVDYCEQHSIRR